MNELKKLALQSILLSMDEIKNKFKNISSKDNINANIAAMCNLAAAFCSICVTDCDKTFEPIYNGDFTVPVVPPFQLSRPLEWVSYKERKPDKTGRYLTISCLLTGKFEVFDLWFDDGLWLIDEKDSDFEGIVYYWAEMPELPKKIRKELESSGN